MRNSACAAFAALAVAACGGADAARACADYIAALNTCFDSLGATATAADDDLCAAYDDVSDVAAHEAATLFACYAAAYNDADCSTLHGVTAASTALDDCATAPIVAL
jgi:hypothetical protein